MNAELRMVRRYSLLAIALLALSCDESPPPSLVLATTTSVQDSGLLDHLAREFRGETGIEIRALSVGSGKALRLAASGQADVAISHDPVAEHAFVDRHKPPLYRPFMFNEFAIAGPRENPARIVADEPVLEALRKIAASNSRFCSRGDESGTHARELLLWKEAHLDPAANPNYAALGQSMGALLRSASEMRGYALTDLPTFTQFSDSIDLVLLNRGDRRLRNVYAVTLVRSDPTAERFVKWLVSPRGRRAIALFRIDGKQLFFPLDS